MIFIFRKAYVADDSTSGLRTCRFEHARYLPYRERHRRFPVGCSSCRHAAAVREGNPRGSPKFQESEDADELVSVNVNEQKRRIVS